MKGGVREISPGNIDWAHSGGVWHCPDDQDQPENSGIAITFNANLLGGNGGANYHPAKSLAAMQRPAEVLLAADTNKPYFAGVVNQTGTDFVRVEPGGDVAGITDETSTQAAAWVNHWFRQYDWTDLKDDPNNCATGAWTCKAVSFRHQRTGQRTGSANVIFADGHSKAQRYGQMSARNYLPMISDDLAGRCDKNIDCLP
jgi:prepilin-type processing-associated H-X9-DG protein